MKNNNRNHKIIAAGTVAFIAEPALALAHTGGVGMIVGGALAAAAYVFADDIAALTGKHVPSPSVGALPIADKVTTGNLSSIGYKLLNGKSAREVQQDELSQKNQDVANNEDYNGWNDVGDADEALSLGGNKKYLFSEVLDAGFKPSLNKIFLGRLSNGEAVYVAVKDLCHVALAGLTGNGKGNLMRLIMAQLCSIGVKVLMLNPHYMPYDQSGGEDWTPFIPKLERHPAECADYDAIGKYIRWMSEDLLKKRIERARKNQPIGRPYFVVIDEVPAVVAHCKDAPGYIGELLREGRKYGIYIILASQDFQVKTIGLDGGGVRKCLKTVFYVGGDQATARALLGEDEDGRLVQIPENDLGTGTLMLRCSAVRYAQVAQVPFVDNASLYRLIGPSTLDQFTATSETQTDELSPTFNDDWKALTGHDLNEVVDDRMKVEPAQPLPTPVVPESGPRAADIDLAGAIILWNAGYNSENRLMKAYPGLKKNQAHLLRGLIMKQADAQQEVE